MRSLAGNQAFDQPIQPLCAWVANPAALGLSLLGRWAALGLNHAALESQVLGLWVEQLASAPDALPPEVSGVGAQFANLRARNRASGERRGCLSGALAVQGLRGEGRQGPRLLPRIL